MAYTVSNTFKNHIKDATMPKGCIVLLDDAYFDDKDFTGDVTVQQYFNTSEDLTFGDCPSDSLSFTVLSNGKLVGYSFGRAKVYFGTMTASVNYSMGGNLAHIEIGNVSYNATEDGLYKGSTKIDDGRYVSLVSDGTIVYAVGPDGAVKVVNSTSAVSKYVPTTFMADKLLTPTSAVFNDSTATVWTDGTKYTYEYVPMGEYNVEKPRSTVGAVVSVTDAHDDMTKFDKDASDFVSAITYPITLGELFEDLCEFCGVSYVTSTFPNSNLSMSSSPFSNSSFNCRQILSWIAEKAYRVAHMNRTGQLELVWLSNDVESLTASDVMTDGYIVSEYVTQAVDSVLLKAQNGSSVTYGDSSNNPYPITGNPFINTITAQDLAQYKAIPTYVPIAMAVFEADPSVDIGDRIDFEKIALDYVALSDIFANVYADVDRTLLLQQYGEAYQYPLMNRTIVFNGGLKATYEATGNQKRAYDARYTEYNALISVNESQLSGAVDEAKLYSDEELNAFKNGQYAQFVTQTATDIANAQSAAEQTASDALQSFIGGQYAGDLHNLQTQIDGQIETYFNNYIPTLNNFPASQWTNTATRDKHLGDLFYIVDNPDRNGETYRFAYSQNEYKWILVEDTAVTSAIQQAQNAYALAGAKKRVFTAQPVPPYDVGDLWVNGNDFYYCRTAQASGSYVASHWTTATGYTKTTTYYQSSFPTNPYTGDLCIRLDMGKSLYRYNGNAWEEVRDTGISQALANAADAQETADGKIVTFAQNTQPSAKAVGDLWIKTNENNRLYRWSGSEWQAIPDTYALANFITNTYTPDQTATQNAINTKTATYYQNTAPTSGIHSGDLWINTAQGEGNKLYRYDGNDWVNVQDAGIQIAIANAADAQATADGKIMTYAQNDAPTDDPEGTLDEGDLWIDTNDNNKLYRWSGSSWMQYTDNSAVVAYDQQLDQMAVFNKLTNNQANQGIYIQDGKIYVNAEYIKAGVLTGVEINNGSGTFRVSESGVVYASDLRITGGSIDIEVTQPYMNLFRITSSYTESTHRIAIGAEQMQAVWESEQGFSYTSNYSSTGLVTIMDGHIRTQLSKEGLTFLDANGNRTANYPATPTNGNSLAVCTCGYNGSGWNFKINVGGQYGGRMTFIVLAGHQSGAGYTRMMVCTATITGAGGEVSSVAISYYQPYQNTSSLTASYNATSHILSITMANAWAGATAIYDSRFLDIQAA